MQVHSHLQHATSVLQGRTGQEQVTLDASEIWQEIELSKRGGGWGGGRGRERRRGGELEREGAREKEREIERIKRTATLARRL